MKKELTEIGRKIAVGLILRCGTVAAVWLAAYGVPQEIIDQLQASLLIVAGLLFDLAMVFIFKGKVK